MNRYQLIENLINQAIVHDIITPDDCVYVRNRIMELLALKDFKDETDKQSSDSIPDIIEKLVQDACRRRIIENTYDEREILAAKIMDSFLSKPSEIHACFWRKYKSDPTIATDYFYNLSKNINYIKTQHIARNICYSAKTEYGNLDITINLSKPEKNPADIAKEKEIKSTNYPKCLLCVENEGYAGRTGHPARSNHRLIRLQLLGEKWYLQYSPYVYYNEHCIVLSDQHRDMKINRNTLLRLVAFVEMFPHYFIGSNADLPIVGGSILSHDHYQGGRYEFPLARAEIEYTFTLKKFPEIQFGIVKWPMSTLRLTSKNPVLLVNAAVHIMDCWSVYSDPSAEIHAFTDHTPHNTITPIARMRDGHYEMDVVLRNNRTSDEHPLGIFHPHNDVQHIKKENIGLIEVMGLAILPARLEKELAHITEFIKGNDVHIEKYHKEWAHELKKYFIENKGIKAEHIVREATAAKFSRVLHDAGIFKRTQHGMNAFKLFVNSL